MNSHKVFKAMSDSTRREVIELLKGGRMTAGEISSHFKTTAATISYHLSTLKEAGLVSEEKDKNNVIYELNVSVFESLIILISSFIKEEDNDEEK